MDKTTKIITSYTVYTTQCGTLPIQITDTGYTNLTTTHHIGKLTELCKRLIRYQTLDKTTEIITH